VSINLENKRAQKDKPVIRTPDYRLCVFISSTLKELAEERETARQGIVQVHDITDDETWGKAFTEGEALTMQQALAITPWELQSTK
jgi:hypothetical protein